MIKFNEEEVMLFGIEASNSSYEDQSFKILGCDDDKRDFTDCYFIVEVSDNQVDDITVFNLEDECGEMEIPELTQEEESYIKGIVNGSIQVTLDIQRENEEEYGMYL